MNNAKALSYCNCALVDLGAQPIVSFSDGSAAAAIATQRYETCVREMLSYSRWAFATIQTELAQLSDAPLFDWQYAYTLPNDPPYLRMVRVARTAAELSSTSSLVFPRAQRQDFAIRPIEHSGTYISCVFADDAELFIEYLGRVDERLFPPAFEEAMIGRMALAFAYGLTNDMDLVRVTHERLYGRPGRAGTLGRAVFYDRGNAPRPGVVDDAGLITGR